MLLHQSQWCCFFKNKHLVSIKYIQNSNYTKKIMVRSLLPWVICFHGVRSIILALEYARSVQITVRAEKEMKMTYYISKRNNRGGNVEFATQLEIL